MIGEGGNAKVFAVIPLNSQELLALKYLSVRSEEKEQRFHDEVKIMKDNASISGIMPRQWKCEKKTGITRNPIQSWKPLSDKDKNCFSSLFLKTLACDQSIFPGTPHIRQNEKQQRQYCRCYNTYDYPAR